MPARPVWSSAVRSAISTASSPVTPSFAGRGSASRKRTVTSAAARSPSACTTCCSCQAARMRGLRWPSAATPRVLVPLHAVRHVHAQPMPGGDELTRTLLTHAEQHLELVVARGHTRDAAQRLADQPLVVRRDADVGALLEQRVQALDEVRAHRVVVGERDRRRLDVDALAEAEVRPPVGERADVVERAAEVRLEYDADVVEAALAQLAVQAQRLRGRRRVLHVDADEVAVLRGLGKQPLEVLAAEVVGELEPESRRLHAHVRVEPFALDRLENLAVLLCDCARLRLARDLLAEYVDRGELPLRVQAPDDAHRVIE